MKNILFILFIAIFSFQSCGTTKKMAGNGIILELNNHWTLEKIDGQTIDTSNAKAPYVIFQTAEKRVVGSGGCNRISGRIRTTASTVSIGPVISTKMACTHMETEEKFLKAFPEKEFKFGFKNNRLVLSNENDRLVFRKADWTGS